nr:reverse transcriptase domain-containing protein [Tanacetum cinerariifolium]
MLPVTLIDTIYNGLALRHRETINAAACGTFMKRHLEECYDLIESMSDHHNDWATLAQWSESSISITFSFDTEIRALKAKMAEIKKNLMRVLQGASHGQNPPPSYQAPAYQVPGYQALVHQLQVMTTNEFTNYMKANEVILKNIQTNMTSLTKSNLELKNMFGQFMKMNTASSSGSGTLPSNTITNLKEDLSGIITRSGNAYQGPMIPTTITSPLLLPSLSQLLLPSLSLLLLPLVLQSLTRNPQFRIHELKICDAKTDKSSIDEPPEVKLKDLPPHLEYAFLEGDDKLTVIIAKYLSDEEKTALITVLKSHKQAITWKLSDIKGEDSFMVKEGIVLGHNISKDGIEVDKDKVDVIAKLPHPTIVKDICSFLGHADFYRRFIKDFSKIAQPMNRLLEKDTPFFFSKECVEAFQTLKRKLTEASILIAPD